MRMALRLAEQAAKAGEVPVGAVLVRDGVVIGEGRNNPIHACDPSAHAEMNALRAAASASGNYRLEDCTLYVTLEPCAMCSGAILHGRLKRVVFGAPDPKTGCAGSVLNLFAQPQLNHQTQVEGGVLEVQASALLQGFFRQKRALQRERAEPLREDALRTPDRCFADLPEYPWRPHYISNLPTLAGLRLHYLDEGPANAPMVYLCLHPIPGWSYQLRHAMQGWLEEGARVVVPDLLGFGKSDKPKSQAMHTCAFHCNCLLELLDGLGLQNVSLVLPHADHPLAVTLTAREPARFAGLRVQTVGADAKRERSALHAPYPDAGHRAAERAFAAFHLCQPIIPS
jgi:tRNA(adenine34) deaminase